MVKSLFPLLLVALTSSSLSLGLSMISLDVNMPIIESYSNNIDISTPLISWLDSTISALTMTELPQGSEDILNTIIDVFSLFLLIRLAKIIGSDRDKIIASKVLAVCKEFPVYYIIIIIIDYYFVITNS
jgi:hypothetical protein